MSRSEECVCWYVLRLREEREWGWDGSKCLGGDCEAMGGS